MPASPESDDVQNATNRLRHMYETVDHKTWRYVDIVFVKRFVAQD